MTPDDTVVRLVASGSVDNKAGLDEDTIFYLRSPTPGSEADGDREAREGRHPGGEAKGAASSAGKRKRAGTQQASTARRGQSKSGGKAAGKRSARTAPAPAAARPRGGKGGKTALDDETVVQHNEDRRWVVGPVDKPAKALPKGWEYLPPETTIKERYVILEMVGQGGMGQVYKALDRRREEIGLADPYVALKILKPAMAGDTNAVATFKREAATAQLLSSPRVVEVIDYDQDAELHYIVAEFLKGESLHTVLKRLDGKPMDLRRAVAIIRDLAEALRYAHSKGVVHADFKPGNAFVCEDGRVKLLDFGVARTFGAASVGTRLPYVGAGGLQGVTPAYASCEVLDGKRPDPRDDIYSLAVVAYRLLTGNHPYKGRNALEAKEQKLAPERIKRLKPAAWRTLKRALAFDRAARVQTVYAFIEGFTAQGAGANFRARVASMFGRR